METSPSSKLAHRYRQQNDRVQKLRAAIVKSVKYKKHCRELFKAKSNKNTKAGRKEGISYDSACGFDLGIDFIDKPTLDPTKQIVPADAYPVVFDLETSGLGQRCEILQIAARFEDKEYNTYNMPLHNISSSASAVTGLEIKNGDLVLDSVPVPTVSPHVAIGGFITFLHSIAQSTVLVAHNGSKFDAPLIIKLVREQGMLKEFMSVVCGFADTLPILRKKLSERRASKGNFKQSILAEEYLGSDAAAGAHNALHDVAMLQKLLAHPEINITNEELLGSAMTVDSLIASEQQSLKCKTLKPSLECLKYDPNSQEPGATSSGILTGMITKLAKAGITVEDLLQSYDTTGRRGIEILLGQDIGGHPWVAKTKKVIDGLSSKLAELTKKKE